MTCARNITCLNNNNGFFQDGICKNINLLLNHKSEINLKYWLISSLQCNLVKTIFDSITSRNSLASWLHATMLQCYDDWVTVCPKRGLELTSPPRVSATSATCKPCFISWLQASANNLENTSHWKTSDSSCTLVETFDILRVYFPGECQLQFIL